MKNIKRKTLEWGVIAVIISSATLFFEREMIKLEERASSLEKQRVIYEIVYGDINSRASYPHLFKEKDTLALADGWINSRETFEDLYEDYVYKQIVELYESAKRCERIVKEWEKEQEERDRNAAEIKDYIIRYLEQNESKKFEMLPDRMPYNDRG